jgi:putative ABC transport system permease protein
MSDAFFAGKDAKKTLALLASKRDGVLVSEETKNDYQLKLGDTLNLRLQFGSDNQYHVVPFVFIGVTREFPTAPRDSFLVANASYIAAATGLAGHEDILVKTSSHSAEVAAAVRPIVASIPGAVVTDIGTVQRSIASSLTSMDLAGLTKLELVFSLLFVIGATGLILGLGLNERRRNFAILEALGASARQLGAFVSGEIGIMFAAGAVIGGALGFGIAGVLVKILSGVFDPPPEHLIVPWAYLAVLAAAALAAATASSAAMRTVGRRSLVEDLKRL